MDWKQAAAEIISEICPDAAGYTLRLCEPHELGVIAPPSVGGWFGLASYELAKCDPADTILIVVDPSRFTSDIERVGAVLHELGHWLDWGHTLRKPAQVFRPRTQQEQQLLELQSRLLAALSIQGMESTPEPDSEVPRWDGHGARFVRITAILSYRVGQVCESIRPHHLRFSMDYLGLPEGSWFAPLSDDLTRSGSIRDIVAGPPPEAFRRAWQSVTGEVLE